MVTDEIIIYKSEDGAIKLDVLFSEETVWLTQDQMAKLFGKDRTVITRHINNIFKDGELEEKSNVQKMHIANSDKPVSLYSLDVIISIGYRVKSQNGVIFRKWANKVLKDYLLKGYAVNQKRLEYLEKTIKLIDIAGRMDTELKTAEAKEIIKVINNYSNALNLLDDYDHKRIIKPSFFIISSFFIPVNKPIYQRNDEQTDQCADEHRPNHGNGKRLLQFRSHIEREQ